MRAFFRPSNGDFVIIEIDRHGVHVGVASHDPSHELLPAEPDEYVLCIRKDKTFDWSWCVPGNQTIEVFFVDA